LGRRQGNRGLGDPGFDPRKQIGFPVEALHLPGAEPDQHGEGDQRQKSGQKK
jgi:hypothetical protein